METVFLVICDGIGDRPIAELKRKTPLEAAKTPNLDRLASEGITGAMHTIDIGVRPGSDTAHLALLGYDVDAYYTGRGPFEVAGVKMAVKSGDVCWRVNMGTVDAKLMVVDRRAGRIDDVGEFAKLLNGTKIDGVTFLLKKGTGHRMGMIMRGKGLSAEITDVDPHEVGVKVWQAKPKSPGRKAAFTAGVLNKFLERAHKKIRDLPVNKEREKLGKLSANYLLARGAGEYPDIPSFKDKYGLTAACVAGAGLYKGIGRVLEMTVIEVKGATGKPDSDVKAKIRKATRLKKDFDFIFVHIKGADTLGEDGDFRGKTTFIEKVDAAMAPMLKLKDALVVVTADHSTPCTLKNHSADDVPILMHGSEVRDDHVKHFNERECARGRLGHIRGMHLMPIVIDLMGLAEMFGA